jgi:hypothetical protein
MNAGMALAMYLECLEWMLAPTDRYNHNPIRIWPRTSSTTPGLSGRYGRLH